VYAMELTNGLVPLRRPSLRSVGLVSLGIGAGLLLQTAVTSGLAIGVPVALGVERDQMYLVEMNGRECLVWHMWGIGYQQWYVRWSEGEYSRPLGQGLPIHSSTEVHWVDRVLREDQRSHETARRVVDRRGLPFQGMYSVADEAAFHVLTGIPIQVDDAMWIGVRFAVPTGVIIVPFVANTLVYGIATVGLFVAARRTKWWLRVLQGRCGACGYRIRGLADARCPECGSILSTRRRPCGSGVAIDRAGGSESSGQ